MLRRLLLLVALLLSIPLLGCIVRTHGPGPGPRCHNECAYWGVREQCDRFCRVWAAGACMAWESRCRPVRTCVRWHTRCY